ncbi:MAG: cysteine-rich CWC family protein [Pseudolabrys sp.]
MMTTEPKPPRRIACARCGTAFECGLDGACWCAAEPYRLPLTAADENEDCLCPDCLRKAAAATREPGQTARD